MAAVGIDACRKGWVAVVLSDDGDVSAHFLTEVAAIGDAVPDASSIAIDIPIGLPKSGPREADLVARVELRHRRTSLFLVPSRAVLEARDHASATALSRTQTGSGISQQAFALRSKIFEVEAWLPIAPCPVWEVHPELSYCEMLGEPASAPKKSWHGLTQRRAALEAEEIRLDRIDPKVGSVVAVDDVLDAAAAAWSARRLARGQARPLPPEPSQHDHSGRPIAIWV